MGGWFKLAAHTMEIADVISTFIAPCLQLVLLLILFLRKFYRAFPRFVLYTIYSILVLAIRLSAVKQPSLHFFTYWTTEIIYVILGLLAIYEVFAPALKSCLDSYLARILSLLASATVIGFAIIRSLYHPLGTAPMARFAAGAYTFVPGILLLEAVIFIACLALMFKENQPVQWGRHKLGILLGFGLAASATFVIYLARFRFGPQFEFVFRYAPPAAYVSATVVWLLAFSREEPVTPTKKPDAKLLKQVAETLTKAADRAERDWRNLNFGPSAAE